MFDLSQARSRWLMVAAIVATISACTASQRVVGPNADHVSLTLAVPFADDREAQPFVDAVSRLSNGTVEIDFKGGVHQGEASTEDALLTDVAAGRYDLTWVAQRPWPARGVKSFDALVAPFLIDSYQLQEALLEDPIATQMLAGIDDAGLVGIGVMPGPLRFMASHKALASPTDLRGAIVGIDDTWVGASTFEALGATAAAVTNETITTQDAAVAQLGAIIGNHWYQALPVVNADLPVWPRPVILVAGRASFDRLSRDQQQLIRDAAKAAIGPRTEQLVAEDKGYTDELCATAHVPNASEAERAAFRAAVQPVYDDLAKDATTASFIDRINTIKATIAPRQGVSCGPDTASPPAGSSGPEIGFPDGKYHYALTPDEVDQWIRSNQVPASEHLSWRPAGCPCSYSFIVKGTDLTTADGDVWRLNFAGGDHVSIGDSSGTYTFRWSYANGALTLSDIVGGTWDDREVWTIKPWTRDP